MGKKEEKLPKMSLSWFDNGSDGLSLEFIGDDFRVVIFIEDNLEESSWHAGSKKWDLDDFPCEYLPKDLIAAMREKLK